MTKSKRPTHLIVKCSKCGSTYQIPMAAGAVGRVWTRRCNGPHGFGICGNTLVLNRETGITQGCKLWGELSRAHRKGADVP